MISIDNIPLTPFKGGVYKKFSIIVPVYNRPDEVSELLQSLSKQTFTDFELVLVEDGSTKPCVQEAEKYRLFFPIQYISKENTGRSDSRNVGMYHAKGDYFIFFDSDCIIPPQYLETVDSLLKEVDCYGGPDRELASFSHMQKAINYAMTSFWTTGGIRGGKKKTGRFEPRTFNMGFSRTVYETVGVFKNMFGEDIELSNRIRNAGFTIELFPDAFVYHKRRVNLKKFFKQVHIFGQARINVFKIYPNSLRVVHTLPAFAVIIGFLILILAFCGMPWLLFFPVIYFLLLFLDALVKSNNIRIACLSLLASLIQISGYGFGFIFSFIKKVILKQRLESDEKIKKIYK